MDGARKKGNRVWQRRQVVKEGLKKDTKNKDTTEHVAEGELEMQGGERRMGV